MSQQNPAISKGIDWLLVWLYIILVSIGIAAIFATTYREGDSIVQGFLSLKTDYSKQALFFIIAGVLAIFILLTDSKFFTATANISYAIGMVLLLLVFPFHTEVMGTKSIIRFGSSFQLQPAELCKVFVNLALAKYLSRIETDFNKPKAQLIAIAIAIVPALITIAQSETGLALVYFSFFLVMYREGLPAAYLITGFSVALLVVLTLLLNEYVLFGVLTIITIFAIYLMWRRIKRQRRILLYVIGLWLIASAIVVYAVPYTFEHVLKPHQVKRIYDTIGKEYVPKDAAAVADIAKQTAGKKKEDGNYNVRQSKIAIGSGGFLGKGLLSGTQTRYDFVPEQRTDFIFCTIGEGFGFIGSTILLGIYFLMLMRIVTIAERQRSVFSRCYAYGVAAVLFFHVAINICMTIGLAPVIGIPLPFISYGGTALLTFTMLLFILIRLDADRQMVLR